MTETTPKAADSFKIMPSVEAYPDPDERGSVKHEVVIDQATALHRGLKSRHTAMIGMHCSVAYTFAFSDN